MTPTEPNAGRAELLVRLDKWASIYPTWGDTEAERRCPDAAAQIRADAAEIQTLAARVAALEAAAVQRIERDESWEGGWVIHRGRDSVAVAALAREQPALRPGAPREEGA